MRDGKELDEYKPPEPQEQPQRKPPDERPGKKPRPAAPGPSFDNTVEQLIIIYGLPTWLVLRYGNQILQWLGKGAAVVGGGLSSPVFPIVVPKYALPGAEGPPTDWKEGEKVETAMVGPRGCLPAVEGPTDEKEYEKVETTVVVPRQSLPEAQGPTNEKECEKGATYF